MIRPVASALLIFVLSPSVHAAFTGFDSLVLGTEYPSGTIFTSDGLSFQTTDFTGGPSVLQGNVRVRDFGMALGSGNELSIGGGLNFLLPADTQYLAMRYWSGSPNRGLIINGVATPVGTMFGDFDGMLVGGVLVSVELPAAFSQTGRLVLRGPIGSFLIGGHELAVDNVNIGVPEPSTAVVVMLASTLLACRRP
jgi:hypothetical protein